jgi:hypothetical protein
MTYQWEHPTLGVVVQMFIDDEIIEIENIYAWPNLKKCIRHLFNEDALFEEFIASDEYDQIRYPWRAA